MQSRGVTDFQLIYLCNCECRTPLLLLNLIFEAAHPKCRGLPTQQLEPPLTSFLSTSCLQQKHTNPWIDYLHQKI
ncbi:unnamed protein product [Rhodiola kirilowii]